jgi:plastocyanin
MRRLSALAVVPVVLLAAGCGGHSGLVHTDKNTQAPVAQTMNVAADSGGKLKFDKPQLKTLAGTVQIVMTNPSSVPHNVAIKGHGVDTKGKIVRNGGRSTVTATLKAGTYEFYCSVDGHEQAGMKGKLIVGKSV